jgi:DNA-binding CsgD family transcriptional regulator
MTDDTNGYGSVALLAIGVLALVLALLVADLVADALAGVSLGHVAVEGGAALVAAAGIALLMVRVRLLDREQRALRRRLVESEEDAARWRAEAGDVLAHLRAAIERQFDRWSLSPAEREVALGLLQGLSHKQIAARRDSSERTVRQQAHVLYRKIGLSGRADLAAFFLADLLPGPAGASPQARPAV